ncbi:uncharacterized protein LOC143850717 [Tasmannia lanceolata]|uniref:uncharacterized protein LOC143850717 n=1 Tax=Tasmannia lanceolata TaxID=3420 RepID=UPI0040645D8F
MAYQTPSVVQNENLHVHSGKGVVGAKVNVPKSEQKGRKERKALADISKARKPSLSAASKAFPLKDKSAVHSSEDPKSIPKSCDLSEEEIKKCNEWAKEGIEYMHYSGNDMLSHEKDVSEKWVEKEVEEVMSALRGWTEMFYGLETPMEDFRKDSKDFMLEYEPEVLLPMPTSLSTSGNEEIDDLFTEDDADLWTLPDSMFELKLKEEYGFGI